MYRKYSGLISLFFFLLCACPYEASFPLSDINKAEIDTALIGTWISAKDKDKGKITINRFNKKELLITVIEEDKVEAMRAFVTKIGNEKFLNLQEIKGPLEKRKWMFVNFKISANKMTFRVVEEDLLKGKIRSSRELYKFIKANLKNKALFDSDFQELKRLE